MTETPAVIFDRVSIVFGENPERALPLMDQGQSRGDIQATTGQILGVHDCSLTVAKGQVPGSTQPGPPINAPAHRRRRLLAVRSGRKRR